MRVPITSRLLRVHEVTRVSGLADYAARLIGLVLRHDQPLGKRPDIAIEGVHAFIENIRREPRIAQQRLEEGHENEVVRAQEFDHYGPL